ncbi:11640_t:CDS:2, partial [Funneliformis mosseae]
PSPLYIPPSLRSSTINEQTVAKSPNYQSPTVSHSSHRRRPRNILAGIENINETTGPERIPSRQAVVEDNKSAATKRDQRRNDKVMQENHGRKNQELVQIESNEVAASSDKEVDNSRKRKSDTEIKDEKRLARVKSACPKLVELRMIRAESQRMYLISRSIINELSQKFVILGVTGIVYTVIISHVPSCTCPDFSMCSCKFCKHILFVYLKVLRMERNSMYIYQKALLSCELRLIFKNAKPDPIVFANRRIMRRYKAFFSEKVLQERRSNEGNCITCYKPLKDKDLDHFLFVQKGFFHNLHKECYEQWKESKCVERIKQE